MPRPNREMRNSIATKAMALFGERAFHSIGLQEILQRFDVSKGTFYFHFKSKSELAEAALEMLAVTVPAVQNACFVGKSWEQGVDGFVTVLAGTEDKPLMSVSCVINLGAHLAYSEPAVLRKATWALKTSERSLREILRSRGCNYQEADRRSATVSALCNGHALRLILTRNAGCIADLKHDLRPMASPRRAFLAAFPPVFSFSTPHKGLSSRGKKNPQIPVDIIDGRSIIMQAVQGRSPADADSRRRRIVAGLADILWRRGYYGTGLSDISEVSSIPKGSLHAHFRDKRTVAYAVLDFYRRVGDALFDSACAVGSWYSTLSVLVAALKFGGLSRYMFGAPLANMGAEFVNVDGDLAARAAGLLTRAEDRLAKTFAGYGMDPGQARCVASTASALWHGHLVRMIIYDDLGPAQECGEDLLELLEK